MDNGLHYVTDLPPAARDALAAATGLPLSENQQFYVVVLNVTEQEKKDRAWSEMQRIAAQAQRNIAASGIKPDEFEALVDDVCHEVRYSRGP